MGWCKVLYLPPLFVRQMTPTHPSRRTTTSHVSRAAVLMWTVVVSVGSERYRRLWYSSYRYQNSRWPFPFHLSHTRHQRVAQIFVPAYSFLCYSSGLAGNYFGGVCSVPSPSVFSSSYLKMDFYHELQSVFNQEHFGGALVWSNKIIWLVWNVLLRIHKCPF